MPEQVGFYRDLTLLELCFYRQLFEAIGYETVTPKPSYAGVNPELLVLLDALPAIQRRKI